MTILGQHTIDETRHLMKTVEFRIQATEKTAATISRRFIDENPILFTDIQLDWTAFKARWAIARDKALKDILMLNAGQPLVPASAIPAEFVFKNIQRAINVGGGETFTKGDLMDCILRIESAANTRIDEKDAPLPSGFDPDFAAYRQVDTVIRNGEEAARKAAEAATKAAKSNIGLMILGGFGLVAAGVVVSKVYL